MESEFSIVTGVHVRLSNKKFQALWAEKKYVISSVIQEIQSLEFKIQLLEFI